MKRGRMSAEDKSTAVVIEGQFGQRPEPPPEFNESQAAIWRETTASEPVDFFGTAALRGLLKDYCRHRAESEWISQIIDSFQSDWIKNSEGSKRFTDLLKMRERETRSTYMIATKLRLTNQARYTPGAAATVGRNTAREKKPWEM